MKRFFAWFMVVASMIGLSSCAKDSELLEDVSLTGNIQGVVKDFADGHLLSNCNVTLSPENKSCITGEDGSFSFKSLKSGDYTLTFVKSGYNDASKTVTVVTSQTTDASITMKSKGAFSLSENALSFGDLNSSMSFTISNNSDTQCTYEVSNIPAWASFSSVSGTVSAQGNTAITVTVDRDKVDYGKYTQNVNLSYKAGSQGTVTLALSMEKVKLSEPTVAIAASALNVTQNSFEIGGQLLATGGMTVSAYGHCWSMKPNPTVNDMTSNNGSTQSVCEYKTTLSNLSVATTYYVRAYATNAIGTAYSEQIVVTTQDVESNKWDGNIAKSFANGNGTAGRPYEITTGGELLLMKDFEDKYFVLKANIDLDNKNWLPFDFSGTLEGGGFTIRNLYVKRADNNVGLFSRLKSGATVHNLTIKGVLIDAGSNENVGALAGSCSSGIDISGIKVVLTEDSQILGNKYVGGLVGYYSSYGGDPSISYCEVTSVTENVVIVGDKTVGGLVGSVNSTANNESTIRNCVVTASVQGGDKVGGIVGSSDITINNCGYSGKLIGANNVGGIVGDTRIGKSIRGCRVSANITGKKYVGGISGIYNYGHEIISCYSTGTISGTSEVCGISTDYTGSSRRCQLCYSTMVSTSTNYIDIIGDDCATTGSTNWRGKNTVGKCKNIVEHLQQSYSQYADDWNFDNTWTWQGKIDGVDCSVKCPKLAWE